MSQDGDLVFSSSDSLVMADFCSLTEFEDFRKDLFLSNTIEGITEGGLLEEVLDSKDDLKLIAEVSDALEASIDVRGDGERDAMKAEDSAFNLFVDTDSTATLQFMSMSSQLDLPTVSAGMDMKSIGLTCTFGSSSVEPSLKGDLTSNTALVAANELSCISLEELEQLVPIHETDTALDFSLPVNFEQGVSLATSREAPHQSLLALSSPPQKDVVGASMFKVLNPKAQCFDAVVTPPVQIKPLCRSSSLTFCNSDGSSSSKVLLRSGEACNVLQPEGARVESVIVNAKPESTTCGIVGESIADAASLQRSQSGNSLGQVRMSHFPGACTDDVPTKPICKQEVQLLPSASGMHFFPLSPYQASTTQGLAPMRRVYSTGDLQVFNGMQGLYGLKAENFIPEDTACIRIGHYTLEERKMKLHRYRQKRTERNFSKKIKYACRKTLADNRTRVRGRFARSDEMGDLSLKSTDLPLSDEYEAVKSHQLGPLQVTRDQHAHFVVNNSCIMSSTPIGQFWTPLGMKVAM